MAPEHLVSKVKEIQRQPGGKDLWSSYVRQQGGGGKNDPALREAPFLKQFLQHAASSGFYPGGGGGGGGGGGFGKGYGKAAGNPMQSMMAKMMDNMMGMMSMMSGGMGGMGKGYSKGMNMNTMGKFGGKGGGKSFDKIELPKFPAQSAEHADAIAKVKAIQKTEGGKEAWYAYVERIGASKKDPGAHEVDILEVFLSEADPSGEQTSNVKAKFDEKAFLASKIKQGQKQSDEFKAAWSEYIAQRGQDNRDPTRHNARFLKTFLDSAPSYEHSDSDPEHPELVRQIKEGQRNSTEFKEMWWKHCAAAGEGKNDPQKHSADFLRSFLSSSGRK